MGLRTYDCTPWGMPSYSIFGWQKPCYLLQDAYFETYAELLEQTEWHQYGAASGNPRCANCMVHSGYEASAVNDTFGSLKASGTRFGRCKSDWRLDPSISNLEFPNISPG